MREAQRYVQQGKRWVVDVDLSKFFDWVNHDILMGKLALGRSLAQVCERLAVYLRGWKGYFRLAATPGVFAELDKWIRHRLRALQLKQWKRGTTIFRELTARGLSRNGAAKVAGNGRRWWANSAMAIHIALPNKLFDQLGVPRLAA